MNGNPRLDEPTLKDMFDYKLVRVEKRLSRLYRRGRFRNKNIYLFGVSENTRQIIRILRTYRIEPDRVLDNDPVKHGTYCSKIPVGRWKQ